MKKNDSKVAVEEVSISTITAHSKSGTLNSSLLLMSPLLVILVSFVTSRIFRSIWGVWAWAPDILIYWILIAILVWRGGGKAYRKIWLGRSKGHWGWKVLALVMTLPALPMILAKSYLLHGVSIWLPWLLLGLINPFLEEGYWRGLILDSAVRISKWLVIIYSAAFFALNHLVGLGTTSIACRNPIFLANVFITGIFFGIIYFKTGSLRC